jgi:hypothetical protein
MRQLYFLLLFILFALTAPAQTLTQTVRGIITDAESKRPIEGVVIVLASNTLINTATDSNGYYSLKNVPVGRQTFQYSFVGYEKRTAADVLVTSGKELELNISLVESFKTLKEINVTAGRNRIKAMNEFATVSSRTFSVEETKRYAASVADPARMAQNFAGVSGVDDQENGIVVRGNSPKGILWRLEGIEIPNPNHFSAYSNSGGAVSMLNASVLGNSDFYTGAFPAEIGGALSGAFDLQFRNGNKDKREHVFQLGTLGVEAATEGPFKKGGQSSYLFNYRYSTLTLLQGYFNLGGVLPEYQDASFKLNFPTKKAGTFGVFGLWGYNTVTKMPEKDSTTWTNDNPNFKLYGVGNYLVAGISHQYFITKSSYIKTVFSTSNDKNTSNTDTLNPALNYALIPTQASRYITTAYRLSVMYNNKLNSNQTLRSGIILQQLGYEGLEQIIYKGDSTLSNIINSNGNTQYYQAYAQWKNRFSSKFTFIGGLHGSYYALNNKSSIEPRLSLSYTMGKSIVTFATGLHSKPEQLSISYFQYNPALVNYHPNISLDLLRAYHSVLGFETSLPLKTRLKIETYYQYLYNIPVEADSNSPVSSLNADNIYFLLYTKPLVSKGTGRNYGVDVSIERPFADNYYGMISGSLFESKYTNYGGQEYYTMFSRGYQLNIIGGKEFKLSKSGKTIFGINGKMVYSGGLRESPIDIAASLSGPKNVYYPGQYYTIQSSYYFRVDGNIYIKLNYKRATHSLQFDVQNITNRRNQFYSFLDRRDGTMKILYQTGFIPNIAYRIEFH